MPDTELSNIDGNHHRLSDYKGKYLLLDFGAEVVDTVLNHFLRWKSYPICGKKK